MDHLPHRCPPIAVPYLVLEHRAYDGLGVFDFPSRVREGVLRTL
jgi:hypothetical protein